MNQHHPWQRPVFLYVLLVGLGLLLARLFHFVLLAWLTIFGLPLFWLLLLVLVLIGVVWSIVFWLSGAKTRATEGIASIPNGWWRSLPLIIQMGALLLALLLPLDQLWLTYNFHRYYHARQQVISLIQANKIPSSPGMIKLPAAYQPTSMGNGEVQVMSWEGKDYVLFFILREFGGAAGFLYSKDGTPPPTDMFSGYQLIQQHRVEPNWYYVKIGD